MNDDRKQEVYTRAAQYHKDKYGVFPSKVRVHTSWGMRPMYYYNERTYVETMQRALQEYMDQLYGH